MRRKLAIGLAVAAFVGLGVAGVPLAERYAASRIKAEIERAGEASVGTVEVSLIGRSIVLTDVHSRAVGDLRIGRWEATGLADSLADLLAGRTPFSTFKLGDPLRADHIEVVDAHLADPSTGATWNIDSLVVDGLDLASYDPNADGPYRLAVLWARIAKALEFGNLEERNVSYTLPATGDTVFIRRAAVHRFDRGAIGAFAIADVEATPMGSTEANLKVDDVRAQDIGLTRVLSEIEERAWRPSRPLRRIDIGSVSATGFGGTLLSSNGISLESVSLETAREAVGAGRSRLRVEGLTVRPAATLGGAKLCVLLQAMGLSEFKFVLDCTGAERRAQGELAIEQCKLSATDLGELAFDANFVGADEAFWRAIDDGNTTALPRSAIALASARLVLIDKGMIDRSARWLAAITNQSPAGARANLARDIRTYQPPDVLITEDLTKLLDIAARFVEQGGTFTLNAKPDPPFELAATSRLSGVGPDLVNLLGLSATLSH